MDRSTERSTSTAIMREIWKGGFLVERQNMWVFNMFFSMGLQVVNPSFPNPRRRLRLRDLAERVIDAQENEQELNKLLNEALLERETVQA